MRTTLKINNEAPDDSLYVIELQHREIGELIAPLLNTFTRGPMHSAILISMMTNMPPHILAEFFVKFKESLPADLQSNKTFELIRALFMHRAELCATLPADYVPKSTNQP